jgi:hypothetical protein
MEGVRKRVSRGVNSPRRAGDCDEKWPHLGLDRLDKSAGWCNCRSLALIPVNSSVRQVRRR